ncbi:MAG: hypothetical protein D6796_02400 [Caldilineae bacterium]|nr:MAG: hypothetical protein D6796_02400 [Caldilineae bacterium]
MITPPLLQDRFQQLDWPHQLGNLASTMAHIASNANSPEYDSLTADLLREAALLIEWSAPHVPAPFQLELANMQRELLAWHRLWPLDAARPLLAMQSRGHADRLLQIAGFIG